MISKSESAFETRPGFSVGIVLTTPPFPYPRSQVQEPVGLPVVFEGALSNEDRSNLHYCELGLEDGQLVTAGI
jgi:phosphoribosylamine---glycine ligase